MGSDEEWRKAAMEDDAVVAELLLHLNQAPPPRPPVQQPPPKPVLPLGWSLRQRRSKAVSVSNYAKKLAAPRASPSTPLSWSGGTSVSGGCGGGVGSGSVGVGGVVDGGSEESSKPQPPFSHPNREETTRSKVTGEATTSKRPRKKKTLAELKEEEIVQLKESRQLKKELITLRVNLEKERTRNENLKRMKLDVQSQMANERGTTVSTQETISVGSSDPPTAAVVPTADSAHAASLQFFPPDSRCGGQKEVATLVLPDLNLPFEDDCSTKVLCGVS